MKKINKNIKINITYKNYLKKIIIILVILIIIIFLLKLLYDKKINVYDNFTNINDSEEYCKYISSNGIIKSCDIYSSSTPISSIKHLNDYDFSKGFENCSIYVCTSAIPDFVKKINDINYKFTLVSGDADESTPTDIFSTNEEFINFIENDKIIHWYAQNCVGNHKKLSVIPIGLDYHTISNNKNHSWDDYMSPKTQEELLCNIKDISKPFWERTIKCYSNFHFTITDSKFGYDRNNAMNNIPNDLIYFEPEKIKRTKTWENMSSYCFIISPHGNGLDCHRTWESLCLGCIPIVKTSVLDVLFNDLPVLIVNDWNEVSLELCNKTIDDFKNKHLSNKFNYDKLLLKYWINKIKTN
jgi:hypothetical protein